MMADAFDRPGRFLVAVLIFVLPGGLAAPAAEIAGETLASETLRHDTQLELFMQDGMRDFHCANGNRKVVKTEVKSRPETAPSNGEAPGTWRERWYVDRCGEVVAWDIRFTPTGREIGRQFSFVKDFHDPAKTPVTLDGKLYAAAESGDADRVRELIAQGAKADSVSDKGVPALVAAAGEGHAAAVTALLEGGADVTLANGYGATALHIAAAGGRDEVIKVLLDHGADVNVGVKPGPGIPPSLAGETPLFDAVAGHPGTARLLIERGADVNRRTGRDTPTGTNLSSTPLMRAALNGASESVLILLENGADATIRSAGGQMALQAVGERCLSPEAALALVKQSKAGPEILNGALLAATNGPHERTCLAFAGALLDSGADVNARAASGDTPLILAAIWDEQAMVEFLLSRGADATLKNHHGHTARKSAGSAEIGALLKAAEKKP